MNERVPPPEEGGRILDEPLNDALSRRYLAYALSTITQRALPDVRDGLKPVHRRMRYTECRLTSAAQLLLDGIDEDAVDLRATYDGEEEEPVVLPAGFPNLLANGSSGIAVGMATSIPPHNAAELIDACLLLLKSPK